MGVLVDALLVVGGGTALVDTLSPIVTAEYLGYSTGF